MRYAYYYIPVGGCVEKSEQSAKNVRQMVIPYSVEIQYGVLWTYVNVVISPGNLITCSPYNKNVVIVSGEVSIQLYTCGWLCGKK